jgi:hypothetical protein
MDRTDITLGSHMNEDRQMTIHFNNGTKMELAFPAQIKGSPTAVLEGIKRALESDKLVIEADGKVLVVPWASVKHIEVSPAPAALPFGAIKGARARQ